MDYLFGQAAGQAITLEPPLLAMLIFFTVTTLTGAALWYFANRWQRTNDLAGSHARRLGQALLWSGLVALVISAFFYEGALFRQRFWLYLMLLVIYGLVAYALYFRFTQYTRLEGHRQAEQGKRRRYVPPPHSLSMPSPSSSRKSSSKRRRKSS